MKLESLLKPAKILDEQIIRQYTKLTKMWEDRGHSRYSLALAFNLTAMVSYSLPFNFSRDYYVNFIGGPDLGRTITESFIKKDVDNKTPAENLILYLSKKITSPFRLPLFFTGAGLIGKAGYEFFDYFKTGNGESLNLGISDLSAGCTFFSLSSSIYTKDSDPKLLDKAPFWKTAYEKIKEKISDLIPSPVPEPVPVPIPSLSINNYPAN